MNTMIGNRENVILIGMPSSGKSTAGVLFAKHFGYDFLDCDVLIVNREKKLLPELIKERGAEGFIRTEERILCTLDKEHTLIATGGSAVYGERAMAHLHSLGKFVYLHVPLHEVERRVKNFAARGVVMRGNLTTLAELYEEREPLYRKYADFTVNTEGLDAEETAASIARAVGIL